ncbi:MAG: tyrosine-type recombinase/integrase [Phycisphaerales bacterium]|nr:tyrosine-type recombinase/integrase [Phycisphaerales bacterium]
MGKLYKRDGRWGIDFRDARGQRVRKVVAADKSVAQTILADAMKAVEKMKAGVLMADPREGRKPIDGQIDAYLAELKRLGRDDMYRYTIRKHLEGAAESQGWSRLTDCTPQSISARLKQLADANLAAKTQNAHRADLNAFFAWCVRTGRLEANPCAAVPKSAVKADKKRRALSPSEIRDLLETAPPERAICYRFLALTGLRRSEAAQIQWAHLHLDGVNAHIELPPTITKSGHAEAVPLVPELAAALRDHRDDASDRDPVFAEIPSMPEFRDDLADAGIEEVDARGRKVVLHSLRHSLATMLAASGVPMPVAQRIMRHRDIKLTAEVYQDEAMLPLHAAMQALPSLSSPAVAHGPKAASGA